LEYGVLVLILNPNSFVSDNEDKFTLSSIKGHIYNNFSLERILNGILDNIDGYLLKPVRVSDKELWQILIFLHVHNVVKQWMVFSALVSKQHTV
jgi:hypothetical protein